MAKLSHGDVETLRSFFSSPLTAGYRSCIAAQSYEPRGSGYDPSTDAKLARLVFDGTRHGKSEWARTKRVLDQLSDAHVEVLRIVAEGGADAIAVRTPAALAAGRKLRTEQARERALQAAASTADGASPMTIATRVLEADRSFTLREWYAPTVLQARQAAHDAIVAGLVDVAAAAEAVVAEVVAAYHAARSLAEQWKAAGAKREDDRRAAFRAELADRRASKEAARFERRLLPRAS